MTKNTPFYGGKCCRNSTEQSKTQNYAIPRDRKDHAITRDRKFLVSWPWTSDHWVTTNKYPIPVRRIESPSNKSKEFFLISKGTLVDWKNNKLIMDDHPVLASHSTAIPKPSAVSPLLWRCALRILCYCKCGCDVPGSGIRGRLAHGRYPKSSLGYLYVGKRHNYKFNADNK